MPGSLTANLFLIQFAHSSLVLLDSMYFWTPMLLTDETSPMQCQKTLHHLCSAGFFCASVIFHCALQDSFVPLEDSQKKQALVPLQDSFLLDSCQSSWTWKQPSMKPAPIALGISCAASVTGASAVSTDANSSKHTII